MELAWSSQNFSKRPGSPTIAKSLSGLLSNCGNLKYIVAFFFFFYHPTKSESEDNEEFPNCACVCVSEKDEDRADGVSEKDVH